MLLAIRVDRKMKKRLFELIMILKKKCLRTEESIRSDLNLTPGEFNGLLTIEEGEIMPGLFFANKMDLSPSRASRIINRLVDRGYMELKTSKKDRRSIDASLTKKGLQMRQIVFEKMTQCENRITAQLSINQVKKIKKALLLLSQVM